MPFVLRPYHRFPVVCPVIYEHWFREGEGIVWNLSPTGWRLSGNLPLERGDVCSLKMTLPTHKQVSVAAGIVRWVRGEEFGLETLVMDGKAQARLGKYIKERMKEL
jgi:PilZ domain